jgi:CheY-like chemotaxis protein
VTDYFMPNGDAQYLLSRLWTSKETANIPVIVLSGRKLKEAVLQELRREICGRAGAAQVLTKSPDPYALFESLRRYCGFESFTLDLSLIPPHHAS